MSAKKEKRYFRDMAALAHERELSAELKELQSKFELWNKGKIDSFELNQEIHEFHDGTSRDLYKRYAMGDIYPAVAYAIANGTITESEINKEYTTELLQTIEHFKGQGVT